MGTKRKEKKKKKKREKRGKNGGENGRKQRKFPLFHISHSLEHKNHLTLWHKPLLAPASCIPRPACPRRGGDQEKPGPCELLSGAAPADTSGAATAGPARGARPRKMMDRPHPGGLARTQTRWREGREAAAPVNNPGWSWSGSRLGCWMGKAIPACPGRGVKGQRWPKVAGGTWPLLSGASASWQGNI